MFRRRLSSKRSLLIATVAILGILTSNTYLHAGLVDVWKDYDADTNTSSGGVVDDETGEYYIWYVNHDTGDIDFLPQTHGDPTPDGEDTGLGPDKDAINTALDQLLKKGGSPLQTIDFWETELGKAMTADGKGPAVTDPWDGGTLSHDPIEGYGGGGGAGFDPLGGGIKGWIQKKQQEGKGNDDEGNDGGGKKEDFDIWGGLPADPAIVNPVPIEKGFTLMGSFAPSGAGRMGLGNSNLPGLGNANMLGAALNRGAMSRQAVNFGPVAVPAAIGGMRTIHAIPMSTVGPSSTQLR